MPADLISAGTSANRNSTMPVYDSLALIYDKVVALPAFPLLCGAFIDTIRRHEMRLSTVVDLGCGTGNFSRYLARRGLSVTGIDQSASMLQIAKQKALELPTPVQRSIRYCEQDIRELDLQDPVDLITCQFNTINYIGVPDELSSIFKSCRFGLKPEGGLLFDFITGAGATAMNENKKINHGSTTSFWRTRTYPGQKMSRVQITLKENRPGGSIQTETHVQRWYSLRFIEDVLARNRFTIVDRFDLEKLTVADHNSYWVQLLARKCVD